jgi:hypothetical protein
LTEKERKMTAVSRILLGFVVWALVLGPGSPFATSHAYADTNVTQYGSNGGYGVNGDDITLLDVASGSADYLYLYQYAYGGGGGYGDNSSSPGKGGAASSNLTGLSLGTYSTSYNVYAAGGQGGYAQSGSAVNGGLGGDALAGFSLTGPGDIHGSASAIGGSGGYANGTGNGNGGNGGQATLGTVYGASISGGTVNVSGAATGGSGGYANGTGNGGNGGQATLGTVYGASISGGTVNVSGAATGGGGGGAGGGGNGGNGVSISLTNKVDGDTSGALTLSQSATGGGGGYAYGAGNGGLAGSAESWLTASKDVTSLSLSTSATGGGGGNAYGSGNGGNGAGATAKTDATNTNTTTASAYARGGSGGYGQNGGAGGQGGLATSTAKATSSTAYAQSNSYAYGGSGGNALGDFAAGKGGNATAMATGNALGTSSLYVNSYASGGQGGISSGNGSNGKSGDALAISTGTGPSGSAGAYATSNLGNGYFVTGQASAPILNGTSLAVAGTNVGQPITNLAEAQGKQAAAFGTALPNQSSIVPLLAQNPTVLASFNGNSTVLGYGVLGGTASSSVPMTFTSSLASNLNIQGISSPQHLIVGLLDSSFTGTDFGSLEFSIVGQGNQLFDKTFSSGAQALAFFDDNILDLGLLTSIAPGSNLNLTFNYSLVGSNDSGFDFNFIYGNGTPQVPIPGTVWLLGSGLVGLIGLKRKCLG